ncbi:hypothetical protein SA21239_2453 [Staphylococcus aureus subsp. aureus 21239]|nr:hypothetical protein SA21239_2453 [Staphylococcus aureus subsp. aureus 21239]
MKYKINGYNIEVYLSGELEKIVKHLFENKFDVEYGFYILFIKPIFEIVFSSNYVKEEFNTKIESSEYRESLDSFNEILMKYLENEINFKEVWKKYIDELFKKLNVQKLLIHKKIESLISSYDKKYLMIVVCTQKYLNNIKKTLYWIKYITLKFINIVII